MVSSQVRRKAVGYLCSQHSLSERKACDLSGVSRSTCRYQTNKKNHEQLIKRLKELAYKRKTFGYRRLHALLIREGYVVNHKKVYRLYKQEGLEKRRRKKKKYPNRVTKALGVVERINQKW